MSDLTLFSTDKLPAYLKNMKLDAVSLSLLSGGSGVAKISIKGSVFRKIVNGEEVMKNEDRAMNMVIVNTAPTEYRTFYAGVYKEGENKGPSCWSSDGVKPDDVVTNPQSQSCATCQQNIKGSGQGDSRACRYYRYVAVVLENDLGGDVLQLVMPSQSVFGKGEKGKLPLRQYATFLSAHNLPITAVVTEMRFDTNSATPKLTFKPIRALTDEEHAQCVEQGQSTDALEAIKMDFKPEVADEESADDESIAVVKAAAKQHAEPADKPTPKKAAAVADAVDEEDEPKVRGKAKTADVKSMLEQWADDDDE